MKIFSTNLTVVAALSLALAGPTAALAADHAEAPVAAADPATDLADLYAWHTDEGTLVTAITFAGLSTAGDDATYDADALYGIHIDNDGDHIADVTIWARFGQDDLGNWGVQVTNLPGTSAPVVSSVEQVTAVPGGSIYAGLRDDPFFFDLQGFNDTVTTGALSFDNTRDSLAGTNVTSLVLEMDLASALEGSETIQVWATTSRF
jgi:hypothetical protein